MIEFIEKTYKKASKRFNEDPEFRIKAAEMTLRLQKGDPEVLPLFFAIRTAGVASAMEIYRRLNVNLSLEDIKGESFYSGIPTISEAEIKVCHQIQTENGLIDFER
jgi:arginyl-tRNA synthetase